MKNSDDKSIYEMLNDIEVDLNEYEREGFNDIEKMKIKKKFRKSIGKKNINNNYKKYISVASVVVISLGIVSATPVGTYASKIIGDLVFDIKSALRINIDKGGYIKTINKSVTKDDITLRLNEAILNDDELIISLTSISKKDIDRDERIWRETASNLYINGELIDSPESSTLSKVSKNNIDEVMFFELDNSKYKGTIDIKLELNDIAIYKEEGNEMIKQDSIDESFVFEFDIDTSKINKDIKNIPINKVIDFGKGKKITLDKFVYTPLSQKIYFTQNDLAFENQVDMILKGTDDLGNEVEFDIYKGRNEVGQLIADTNGEKINKSTKYLILTAYERTYVSNGKQIVPELKEIEKDIRIDLISKNK